MKKIRLAKPYLVQKQKLISLIGKVLDSGYLVQGKYVNKFEQEVALYLGVKHAIAVSSGTAALHISLLALGIGPGDEVVIPAYTFPATANVVELTGAKPVLVDVDCETYNIRVESIDRVISLNTKCIIPVHSFGNPADMGPILEISGSYDLKIVEDAAGALGSEYKGKKCGTLGTVGCFSFHPRKIITTGEGGLVVTEDDEAAGQLRRLRNHGMQKIESKFDFISAGFNYRMNEIEAVLGLSQLRGINKIIQERQKLAKIYVDSLKKFPGIFFQKVLPSCLSAWQAFVIRLKDKNVHPILESLRKSGIEANIGTYAIHMLRFFSSKYNFHILDYSNAQKLYSESLALPFYNGMAERDIGRVVDALEDLLE